MKDTTFHFFVYSIVSSKRLWGLTAVKLKKPSLLENNFTFRKFHSKADTYFYGKSDNQ